MTRFAARPPARTLVVVGALVALFGLNACTDSAVPEQSGEVTMGVDEGSLSSTDGKLTFEMAATTLPQNVRFQVSVVPLSIPFAAGVAPGRAALGYQVTPAMRFPTGATARVTLSYAGLLEEGRDARDLMLIRLDGEERTMYPAAKPDTAAKTFSATVDASGVFLIVKRGCWENVQKRSMCGDASLSGDAGKDAERLSCYRADTVESRYANPWKLWCYVYHPDCAFMAEDCGALTDGPQSGDSDATESDTAAEDESE